MKNMTFWGI